MEFSYNKINGDLTVSQFLGLVNEQIGQMRVTVAGEVTGRVNRRGNVTYFSLHDPEEEAVLSCMAFNSLLDKQGIEITEGMAIKVHGYPEIWKRSGYFSFKVFQVLLTGEGDLKKQFELLLKRLEHEGLFSPEYKKPLPRFVKHVGLITAEGREAQADFLTHLAKRGIGVALYDVRVEGAQAVEQIVEAIEFFNKNKPDIEVLVLTRGGGNLEALQAFNSEAVARAIFASRIPIISAIGHEKDVTIADFVADIRASTPTHAGKILSEDWTRADAELDAFKQKLNSDINTIVAESENKLNRWQENVKNTVSHKLAGILESLDQFEKKLALASPTLRLKQGYSIVRDRNQRIVKSTSSLNINDMLELQLHHGKAKTKITQLA